MSEAELEAERRKLLDAISEARQKALESQAEAAVYRDMLKDYYEAAQQALAENDLSLLPKITRLTMFFTMPGKDDVKAWGKYFLDAYMRDAAWLADAKKSLERIKADAERLPDDNETQAELKERILAAAEEGLIEHV